LGLNQYVTGRTADAERSFNEAKSLRQKVVAGHAANIDHQKDLATSFSMLAHFHGVAGRYDEADSNFQEAKTIEEKLVADHPNDAECALSLSMTYGNRGNLLQRRGQSAEALPYYAQSLKVLEPVLARNPRSADARQSARNSHGARADALVKLRRYADALPDWDQVIALNDDPQRRTWIRIQRAVCLAHAGQTARAVAEAEVLAAVKDAPGALLYDLARICAVASAVGDSNNPGADAPRLAEQYAARAVELLRQAAERGFKDIGYLKKDDDLKLLREREDYKQMLKELDDKSK
jgi:tetratricopeptide (TPR) repeat protein